ncbi:MAG: 7-carboxy-7-deazaguanine synthase QueE [Planctomycetota bacterium]
MKVSEIFYSLQGEGLLAGVPSIFVRLAGCPLRCRWCDTKYAWDESAGTEYSVQQIVEAARWNCGHVVITGGEPLIQDDLEKLVKKIKKTGKHVTIETAGITFVPGLACDLMSISPKLSNSIASAHSCTENIKSPKVDSAVLMQLIRAYEYQMKFVVATAGDIDEITQLVSQLKADRSRIMLMPQAASRKEYIDRASVVADLCKLNGFRFSPRLQLLFWNGDRGV